MQRLLRALLAGLLVLAVGGCQMLQASGPAAPAGPSRIQQILDDREMRVGLTGTQPPLNVRSKSGELIGLEVDLMKALGKSMGLNIVFVERPFAELLPALRAGDVDLVISGMTITPDRNAVVAFAGPYFISGKSVLAKYEKLEGVSNAAVLNDPERTYAALAGSTSEEFVRGVFSKAKLVSTRDYDSAVQMVIDDEVDALIADFPICGLSVLRHPQAGLSTLMTPFTIEPLGIALPADDPLFVNLVQNYLTTLKSTGILTQLKAKWFNDGAWVDELP